ncbi:hypothetical protein PVAG01_01129 [Phlyctema vagabunda]|uniref:Uncharacterized protein n=1 Tax=Phlyctema vagabunda TaxID=108571 RepID=A0ABR4PW79_9HELO
MSHNGIEASRPVSAQSPRHQVKRSITDTGGFGKAQPHRPHHHHYPHIHRKDEKTSSSSSSQQQQQQSTYSNPNPQVNLIIDGIRSEGITPEQSRDGSRRASFLEGVDVLGNQKRMVKEGEVVDEKEKSAQRAAELRNMLMNLNDVSNTTTRRLDTTYYAVLEKLSALQNTIQNLKELSLMARRLDEDFQTESADLIKDVNTQLDSLNNFNEQHRSIEDLDTRVTKGRAKIKTLAERVDIVRKRVEGWERGEVAWQERTRKRLRLLWIIMSIIATILIVLIVFQYTPARTQGPGVMHGFNSSMLAGRVPSVEQLQDEAWNLKRSTADGLETLRNKIQEDQPLEDDPRLRLFDEL